MDPHHPRQQRSYTHCSEGGQHPNSRILDNRVNLQPYQQQEEISYDEKPRESENSTVLEAVYGHPEDDKLGARIIDEVANQGRGSKSNGDISQGSNIDSPNNLRTAGMEDANHNISKDESESNLTNDLTSETQQVGKAFNANQQDSTDKDSGSMANSKDTLSTKDPNELRQKVLESLAEKKKKAAVFITQESEGTARKESPESRMGSTGMNTAETRSNNGKSPTKASASNPEREAAVNALLAEAMGSSKAVSGKADKVHNGGAPAAPKKLVKSPTDEPFDQTRRRKIYPEELKASGMARGPSGEFHETASPSYDDTEASRRSSFAGHHAYPRNDKQPRPKRSPENLPRREGAYKEDYGHSSRPKISPASASRQEFPRAQRAYEHEESDRNDARHDTHHRTDRFEDPSLSAKEFRHPAEKPAVVRRSDGDHRGKFLEEEKLRAREEPLPYRPMDVAREDGPRDPYPRYPRRMIDPNWQDQGPDAPPYPSGRYLPPRDDHRLPPISRPPETDYAALYYKDLTEWLELTGYHDYSYRQMILGRQRGLRAMEDRRMVLEDDREGPRGYPGMPLREDIDPRDPRRARGPSSSYPLLPSEIPPRDDRDPTGRVQESMAHRSSSRAALYPPVPGLSDRARYQAGHRAPSPLGEPGSLKRRAPFRDEYDDVGPVGKSARVNYANQHRPTAVLKSDDYVNAEQSGTHMKHHSGHGEPVDHRHPPRRVNKERFEDPEDAAAAVRQSLSKRIAAGRGREQSPPLALESRVRERGPSPRPGYDNTDRKEGIKQGPPNKPHRDDNGDAAFVHPQRKGFEKSRRTPEPTGPRYDKEFQKPGRSASGKFTPREEFRKPFPGRRSSSDDYRSPGNTLRRGSMDEHKKKPFGRGRGRGYHKEFHPSSRHIGKPDFGDPMDLDKRVGPVIDTRGAGTRYFVVKSFNHDNVKMAQKDEIWATQKKNSEMFEEAFKTSRDVILVFSVNKSGKFQGYARMESAPGTAPVPTWANNLLWESSGPFRIRWVTINDIGFHRVAHLNNRLNEDHPVLIGRDGQEIDPDCGAALCKLIDESVNFHRNYNENGGK